MSEDRVDDGSWFGSLNAGPGDRQSEQAAARVVRRVTQQGPAAGFTQTQVERLAKEWAPLAGALAELLQQHGEPVPAAWRKAHREFGTWK